MKSEHASKKLSCLAGRCCCRLLLLTSFLHPCALSPSRIAAPITMKRLRPFTVWHSTQNRRDSVLVSLIFYHFSHQQQQQPLSKSDAIFQVFQPFKKVEEGLEKKKDKKEEEEEVLVPEFFVIEFHGKLRSLMPNCLPPLVSLRLQWRTLDLSLSWNAMIVLIFCIIFSVSF